METPAMFQDPPFAKMPGHINLTAFQGSGTVCYPYQQIGPGCQLSNDELSTSLIRSMIEWKVTPTIR